MPVERTRGHAGRALAVSGVGIAVIALVLYGVSILSSRQDSLDVRLGDQTFDGGDAEGPAVEDGDPVGQQPHHPDDVRAAGVHAPG